MGERKFEPLLIGSSVTIQFPVCAKQKAMLEILLHLRANLEVKRFSGEVTLALPRWFSGLPVFSRNIASIVTSTVDSFPVRGRKIFEKEVI